MIGANRCASSSDAMDVEAALARRRSAIASQDVDGRRLASPNHDIPSRFSVGDSPGHLVRLLEKGPGQIRRKRGEKASLRRARESGVRIFQASFSADSGSLEESAAQAPAWRAGSPMDRTTSTARPSSSSGRRAARPAKAFD